MRLIGRIRRSVRSLWIKRSEELSGKLINIAGSLDEKSLKEISKDSFQLWIILYVLLVRINQLLLQVKGVGKRYI